MKASLNRIILGVVFLFLVGIPAGMVPAPGSGVQAGEGVQVVRVYTTDPQQIQTLARWTEPWEEHPQEGYVVLGVSLNEFQRLQGMGLRVEVDQGLTERANHAPAQTFNQTSGIPGYACYRTVEETYASAEALSQAHPDLASWIDVGDSWEKANLPSQGTLAPGYDLKVLRLTNQAIPGPKPVLFVMAAIHPREYVTAELLTRFGEWLVNAYGKEAEATWLLDRREIHLLLQANPDGRKLAETGVLWRKNTNRSYCDASSPNWGADLNRNFSFQWGCCGGSSATICNETYHGPAPASEPETQAVQTYLQSVFLDQRGPGLDDPAPLDTQGLFIDLHSYSQLVLWPWGFTSTPAPNRTGLQRLGRKLAWFNAYTPQPSFDLYPTDGSTIDFVYGEMGVPAYTFELGNWFFESCDTFEKTILPDNLHALVYAAKAAAAPYRLSGGPDIQSASAAWSGYVPGSPLQIDATALDDQYAGGGEPVQNIASAEFYIDIPPWITTTLPSAHPMLPQDGRFDTPSEALTAQLSPDQIGSGRHTLFLRAQDTDGNWGPVTAIYTDPKQTVFLPVVAQP